jgi:hypothetical protein
MKIEGKSFNLYHNLGYWFLSFIVLVIAGFYHSYFSIFFKPTVSIIHIHFVLMSLWIATLITQPFLIKARKITLHRIVGRVSYVLVPLVLISAFFMMRHGYNTYVDKLSHELVDGAPKYTLKEILHLAARGYALPFFYFLWMGLFYTLAIIKRGRPHVHARYMVAAALTILGPTVDRIIFITLGIEILPFHLPVETFAFLLIDIILIGLLLNDIVRKQNSRTLSISLLIFSVSQVLYYVIQNADWWESFVTFSVQPDIVT